MDFVHASRYRKRRTTTSDKPVYCSIYLDSNLDISNRSSALSALIIAAFYSREPGMLNAQGLKLRTKDLHHIAHMIIRDDHY